MTGLPGRVSGFSPHRALAPLQHPYRDGFLAVMSF